MIDRQNYKRINAHLNYLRDIHQISIASIRRYRFYLRHLLLWADYRPFQEAHLIRPTFPVYINSQSNNGKGSLSSTTQKKIMDVSRRFFLWCRQRYKSLFKNIPLDWIESLRFTRMAQSTQEHVFVTVDDVVRLITIPISDSDLALQRDQAAAALLFLSGMRATAFTTMPIIAVNLSDRSIRQWPELGVMTKNRKRATTYLLPIPELLEVVQRWDDVVRNQLPPEAVWYSPIDHVWGKQRLSMKVPGKNRNQALTKRLRGLYRISDLSYKSAHKFRHGHAVYGLLKARTIADYKAVSMNLMHNDIKINDSIYAPILSDEVKMRIDRLVNTNLDGEGTDLENLVRGLTDSELSTVMRIIADRFAA